MINSIKTKRKKERLSKIMAHRGLCSRREADRYIERGLVFVDGIRMTELGTKIYPDQKVELSAVGRARQASQITILLNKPIGYISGQSEGKYKSAASLITAGSRWNADRSSFSFCLAHLRGLAPAGRLDIDSTGLLVLTQDGRVARKVIGEDSSIDKEYLVRVSGTLSEKGLKRLNIGLSLDGKRLKSARVWWQNEDQLRFVLREGKKRQIRRMCELVGLKVTGLKRIRMGRVMLGNLPTRHWRYLRSDESF